MANKKTDPVEELQRRIDEKGDGRDPSARRGEIEKGGSVDDVDAGVDQIHQKARGGYGADDREIKGSRANPTRKPLSDKRSDPSEED